MSEVDRGTFLLSSYARNAEFLFRERKKKDMKNGRKEIQKKESKEIKKIIIEENTMRHVC